MPTGSVLLAGGLYACRPVRPPPTTLRSRCPHLLNAIHPCSHPTLHAKPGFPCNDVCGRISEETVRTFLRVEEFENTNAHYVVHSAGDSPHAVAVLVSLFRWLSWSPTAFFSQLLLAAASCVVQSTILGSSATSTIIWRAFVVGRVRWFLYPVRLS